jgi:hypothetical protein
MGHKRRHDKRRGGLERWLHRETHKMLAELTVLVLAAYIAEGTMRPLYDLAHGLLA